MKRVITFSIATIGLCSLLLPAGPAVAQGAAPNTLSDAEKADGWKLLFDGRTTAGWRGFGRETVVGWEVSDGALIALGQGGDHANDIEAGKAAGLLTCAVTYGLTDRATLARTQPDLFLDRLDDLLRHIS